MPVLTSLWLLTRMLAFRHPHSRLVNSAAGLCNCRKLWREGGSLLNISSSTIQWPLTLHFKCNIRVQTHTRHLVSMFVCLNTCFSVLMPTLSPHRHWTGLGRIIPRQLPHVSDHIWSARTLCQHMMPTASCSRSWPKPVICVPASASLNLDLLPSPALCI